MSKRTFRDVPLASQSYPTLDDFDRSSRRGFLAKLGAALAGAGGLALLSACGQRPAAGTPDARVLGGDPIGPDARVDGTPAQPDQWPLAGGAMPMDARADQAPEPPTPGEAPPMDARIDEQPSMGKVAPMDARIDALGCTNPPKP
jgi:hypothetical protein